MQAVALGSLRPTCTVFFFRILLKGGGGGGGGEQMPTAKV